MIGWYGLVIVAFAAYRTTRFVTADSLTQAWRDALFRWAWNDDVEPTSIYDEDTDRMRQVIVPVARAGGFRTYVYEWATCSWCLGVWVTAGMYALWYWVGGTAVVAALTILAAAGVQGFIASRADA